MYFTFFPVVTSDSGLIYDLRKGSTKKSVIADFTQLRILKFPIFFSILIYPISNGKLKAGEYFFPKGSTLFSIWQQITHGIGLLNHAFTIVPGWSFKQLRDELAVTPFMRHTTTKLSDREVMEKLGYPNLNPEGEFYPDTYYFLKDNQDLVILKRAINLMQLKLMAAWQTRDQDLPYNLPYDSLIAASLIEKEAFMNAERAKISGVLVNRLKNNMLLQFDPTVIYGLGDQYTGKIYKDNLTKDTPYNTYIHKGLPPTPIAMPSFASIQAALHPEKHDYLYFVARGDGSHQFSKTLPEHHAAVAMEQSLDQSFFNFAKILSYLHKMNIKQHESH